MSGPVLEPRSAYVVSYARTPLGLFLGPQSKYSAPQLGAHAIRGALDKVGKPIDVDEVFMGIVLAGGAKMAPARQAALLAGLPQSTPCTAVNKVCASGMKAMEMAMCSIAACVNDVVVAGGMESMSNVPHYIINSRGGTKYGNGTMADALLYDGLTWNDSHMGNYAERLAEREGFTRQMQDDYSIESYKRAQAADFSQEIVPLDGVDKDAEPSRLNEGKLRALKPAFETTGSITAGNASTLADGAAALVIMSGDACAKYGIVPIAKLVSFGNGAHEPEWFTTAPSLAMPKALARANWSVQDVDLFEINEAYAVVAMANAKSLGIPSEKLNVLGGAVALGHPLGCSGARIVCTLLTALKQRNLRRGCAGICNGGGGASACTVELL